ncbi:ATP-independent chaperone, alpha-crystallin/Hsp20 family [Geobacter metallireducens GS-15]|uniref:ATP-independent chaperone, alpha-crystallin/Hsp20 family n=2 Tax=Geobacter metallireducens TaxID=28232 RepID=Q39SC0_GEOMG|nr:ATP-independent chaperone, alpha-crystallin/Hsp20 family [Geobacter metallireducens GS-15]
MRRHTELRTMSHKDTGESVEPRRTTGSGTSHETKGITKSETEGSSREVSVLSPIREMERWFEESLSRPFFGMHWMPFRQMFSEVGERTELMPAVDMFEEGGHLVVKAELPGITKENLNLRIVDNNLILSGERSSEEKIERGNYLRLERSHGSFSRTLSLPDGLDTEHIKAGFKDGVLEVRIPRTESSTVREITVE